MKRVFLAILSVVICTIATAQNNEEKAKVWFDATTIDAGTFSADSAIIKYEFVYTNTGNVPFYIHKVTTGCGCTQAEFSSAPLMPGKKDTIHITYDGSKRSPGIMRKSVTLHCNTAKEIIRLYIKGNMLPAKVTEIPNIETE